MKLGNRYKKINEFFNTEYKWWENVYNEELTRGFLSFEMIRRKEILLEMLNDMIGEKAPVAILECGCGPGGILGEISPTNNFLAGVDINFNYLLMARKEYDSALNFLQSDIERLPFKNDSFDIVYCVGVLSYLEDDRNAMREMCRVLKADGKVIISVPGLFMLNKFIDPYYYLVWLIQTIWKKMRNCFFKNSVSDNKFEIGMIRRYTQGQLDRLYREFDLEKKQTICVSYGPPTLWRKEVLPLPYAIRTSEALVRLSYRRGFGFLTRLANHWVTSLEKTIGKNARDK